MSLILESTSFDFCPISTKVRDPFSGGANEKKVQETLAANPIAVAYWSEMSRDKESKQQKKKSKSSSKKAPRVSLSVDETLSTDVASTSAHASSAFETMYPVLNLPIPPVWSNDPYSAFSDLMDTLVMR